MKLPNLPPSKLYKFEFELIDPEGRLDVTDLATQVSYLATRFAEAAGIPGIKEFPTRPIDDPACERMVDVMVWRGEDA